MQIKGIACDTLNFILETSKSIAPEEFAGLLQEKDGIITEVLMLPGTESSEQNAFLKLFMMQNVKAAGSIHSHPGPNRKPSQTDLHLFSKTGTCHIIVGYPYNRQSWTCYDKEGNIRELPVLDAKFEDLKGINFDGANFKRALNFSIEQLSGVKTLYKTKLDEELLIPLKKKYPTLFEEPK